MANKHELLSSSITSNVKIKKSILKVLLFFITLLMFTVANAETETSLAKSNMDKRGFKSGDLILLIDDVYIVKGSVQSYKLPDAVISNYEFLLYYSDEDKVTPNHINCATKTTKTSTLSGPVLKAVITALCER